MTAILTIFAENDSSEFAFISAKNLLLKTQSIVGDRLECLTL